MDPMALTKAQAKKRYAPVGSTTRTLAAGDGPNFVKHAGNPIDVPGALATMFWPCIVPAHEWLASPIDQYYKYDSTDHDVGPGGIRLSTAPTPLGPWTQHSVVYTDTSSGSQTEEPTVIRNPATGLWHMLYQNSDTVQWIGLAKSADGITWTRHGTVMLLTSTAMKQYPGSGHAGYPKVAVVGRTLVMNHLLGGGNYSTTALSYSEDYGETWTTDPRPIYSGGLEADPTRAFKATRQPFLWRGETWAVFNRGLYSSGTATVGDGIYIARLSTDLRQVISKPRLVLAPEVSGWEAAGSVGGAFVFQDASKLYLYYLVDNKLGVAVAEV